MMHNFGIISDLNVHFLLKERQHQDCVDKKLRRSKVDLAIEYVATTFSFTLIGTVVVIYITLAALIIVPIIAYLTIVCWPITVALVAGYITAYIVYQTIEGIEVYKSQTPYYKPPIKKYQNLIKRTKKPFGARLTDFFRC